MIFTLHYITLHYVKLHYEEILRYVMKRCLRYYPDGIFNQWRKLDYEVVLTHLESKDRPLPSHDNQKLH